MEKEKAYLFLRVPDRSTPKAVIRNMVTELEQYASQEHEVLKTVVKVGHTRFSSDAVDPELLKNLKESGGQTLIVRSFSVLSTSDAELRKLYKMLDEEGIRCKSMTHQSDLCSYLYHQNVYQGLLQYE